MEREGLFNFSKRPYVSSCQDQELVGHLPVEPSSLLRKFLSREGCSSEFLVTGLRILEDGLSGHTAFSNNQKMVSTLHKKLEYGYCM